MMMWMCSLMLGLQVTDCRWGNLGSAWVWKSVVEHGEAVLYQEYSRSDPCASPARRIASREPLTVARYPLRFVRAVRACVDAKNEAARLYDHDLAVLIEVDGCKALRGHRILGTASSARGDQP